MDKIKLVPSNKLFDLKQDKVYIVETKYNSEEAVKLLFEDILQDRSIDSEYRKELQATPLKNFTINEVYRIYYRVNVNFSLNLTTNNAVIDDKQVIDFMDGNFLLYERKESVTTSKALTYRFAVRESYNINEIQNVDDLVVQTLKDDKFFTFTKDDEEIDIIGLALNRGQITKRINKDTKNINKKLIRKSLPKVNGIEVNNIGIVDVYYVLIPYTIVSLDNKVIGMVHNLDGAVKLNRQELPHSYDILYHQLLLKDIIRINSNLWMAIIFLLAGSLVFYPLMWLNQTFKLLPNPFLGLVVSLSLSALIGTGFTWYYRIKNRLSYNEIINFFKHNTLEEYIKKRKGKRTVLFVVLAISLAIAIFLIVVTFKNF